MIYRLVKNWEKNNFLPQPFRGFTKKSYSSFFAAIFFMLLTPNLTSIDIKKSGYAGQRSCVHQIGEV